MDIDKAIDGLIENSKEKEALKEADEADRRFGEIAYNAYAESLPPLDDIADALLRDYRFRHPICEFQGPIQMEREDDLALKRIEEKLDKLLFLLDDHAIVHGRWIDLKGLKICQKR
jgi:hypothetical protein